MLRPKALLLALSLLVVGCVAPREEPPAPAPEPGVLPFPDPMGQEHDHADPSLHVNAYNLALTDHQALAGTAQRSSNVHALDVKAGWLFAAVYGNEADDEGGFFLFNVSDPEKPQQVGRFRFRGPLGGDRSMEATPDAEFVVLGTELVDCAGHVNPFAPGLYLVDVRDKANPKIAAFEPDRGIHSVAVHRIGGVDYVFTLARENNNVFRIDKGGPVPRLVRVSDLPIGHDSLVMDDPLLDKPLLYAANGAAGFTIHDVSDPASPKQVAEWNIPDRKEGMYYIHTGAVSVIDGRRIVVVTTEDWEDYPSALWVLDATDLGAIETLSNWSAPGNHPAKHGMYSMHNPRFHGSVLVLTYYHGGVWALDLSTHEKRLAPPVVGQYMPGETDGGRPVTPATYAATDRVCPHLTFGLAPLSFDVESGDGVVYVADLHTGLYTLRPSW